MMKRFQLILVLMMLMLQVNAQDYLAVPSVNPALFSFSEKAISNEKLEVIDENFIYLFDTLNLPFVDDFSKDRLRKKIRDTSSDRLTDSLFFKIRLGNRPFRGGFNFTTTPTFKYTLNPTGDTTVTDTNSTFIIQYADLDFFPIEYNTVTVYPAFNFSEQNGTFKDTVLVEAQYEQDSLIQYTVAPNANDLWTDRSAYINRTFAINPPSIGVVTFDGLNEDGEAYDIDNPFTIVADYLTSLPIRLENLPDTNVYLSFFYEPKGISIDKPEKGDSLVVEFYNVDRKRWIGVWNTIGFDADTFSQAIVRVPTQFHKDGFQFRFKNYANSAGAFDQWHVDYVYLDNDRDSTLPVFNDVAYIYDAPSMLKDYYAMPFWHYKNNPISYMDDTARTVVKNHSNITLQVFNFLKVPDTTSAVNFYQFPSSPNATTGIDGDETFNFSYPTSFEFPANKIDSAGVFESIFDVRFSPRTDFIRSNDTVISRTVLKDYYAYDDGTAEAGYGINPALSTDGLTAYMAVKYEIPFDDTLKGIQTYFLPQALDVTKQRLFISVWSSISPSRLLFQREVSATPVFSEPNGLITFSLDTALVVGKTFYVGVKTIGATSVNIGYDLNTNHKDKIVFSQNGTNWSAPSNGIRDGALMIRPVFRNRVFDVGIDENRLDERQLKVYPNPTSGILNLKFNSIFNAESIALIDMTGKLILFQPFQNQIDLSYLPRGIYFLKLQTNDGQQLTKKVILSH